MLAPNQSLDKLVGPEAWQRLQTPHGGEVAPADAGTVPALVACAIVMQKVMGSIRSVSPVADGPGGML
jgi:hypothetical protein